LILPDNSADYSDSTLQLTYKPNPVGFEYSTK
jgi:hypothetical protein